MRRAALVLVLAACGHPHASGGDDVDVDVEVDAAVDPDATADAHPTSDGPLAPIAPTWQRTVFGVMPQRLVTISGSQVAVHLWRVHRNDVPGPVTIGAAEPGEVTLVESFQHALMWLDPTTGTFRHGRRIETQVNQGGGLASGALLERDANGGIVLAASFTNTTRFHPDTPAERTLTADVRPSGDSILAAYDPIVTRYDAASNPGWIVRGVTPSPITQGWFNYADAGAALPDGGVIVAGQIENAGGFAFAGQTLPSSARGYIARLGAAGNLVWVRPITSSTRPRKHRLRTTPAGDIYGVGWFGGGVLAVGSTAPFQTPSTGLVAYRLTPDGAVAWARTMHAGPWLDNVGIVATGDGDLAGAITFDDDLELRDAAGTVIAHLTSPGRSTCAYRFASDGTLRYAVVVPGEALAIAAHADGRIVLEQGFAPGEVVAGFGALPTIPNPTPENRLFALVELAPNGSVAKLLPIGIDIYMYTIDVIAGSVVGMFWEFAPGVQPLALGDGHDWTWLPPCDTFGCTVIAAWPIDTVVN